jgi:hypothetical protein
LFTERLPTTAMFYFFALFLQLTLSQSLYYVDSVSGSDIPGCGLSLNAACSSLGFCVQTNPPNSNEPITYKLAAGFYKQLANTNITWAPGQVNPPISIVGTASQTAEIDFGGGSVVWTFAEYPANISLVNLTLQNMFGAGISYSLSTGNTPATFNVVNCIFQRNNFAQVPFNYYPYGSALNIHTTLATTNIINTQFINNNGDVSVDSYGPLVVTAGNVFITQSMFFENTANSGGVVAYCAQANGCNGYVLDISNSSFTFNTGNNTASILVNGYSLRLSNAWLNANIATDSIVKILATNKNDAQIGSASIGQASIINNTCRHAISLATLAAFTSYATTLSGSTVQFNNNSYDAGLGVGVFCNSSQITIDLASIVSINFNTNGSAGGAVDYFGVDCQITGAPTAPSNTTSAPTAPGGTNAAAIVVPLFVVAFLLAAGIFAYYKWDQIKTYFGRNEYTQINEGTRF